MITQLLSNTLADEATAAGLAAALERDAPDAPSGELHELAALLEQYLKSLPQALDALTAMTKEPRFGRSAAFVTGQALIYLVDEDDLFPETELGALGLIDDAYLVHGCIAALLSAFPELAAPTPYSPPDDRTMAAVRSLFPAGVAGALDRTCENLVHVAAGLYSGGAGGPSVTRPERPPLRVGEALAALNGASQPIRPSS
jgi:uncharacterized membrane protein YkvA (DUF1232 family)